LKFCRGQKFGVTPDGSAKTGFIDHRNKQINVKRYKCVELGGGGIDIFC